MTDEVEEIRIGVHIEHDEDLEQFAVKVGKAISRTYGGGTPPQIAISHTATPTGFHYLAVITGYASGEDVTVKDNLDRE